jgi:hypothetical protein
MLSNPVPNGEITVSNQSCPSYALIDGAEISELDLLRYEVTRARTAAFLLYERIGAQGMAALLKCEIATMQQIEHEWVKQSAGEWSGSITDVRVNGGSASGFLTWFRERVASDDRAVMFNAHPEHYAVVAAPDGRVSILETAGGWRLPGLFYARFTQDERDAAEAPDPTLPVRLIGHLESENGEARGRVLHQFGDTPYGFRARLGIYWPAKAEPEMIKGHQWHLACEFVNWTRMYVESRSK